MYLMTTGSARKMMLDSGASHHMVNIDDLSEEELATRRDLSTPRNEISNSSDMGN